MVKLVSPLIPVNEDPQLCFSFWYAAFGAGESALMQISKQDNASADGGGEKVNLLTQKFFFFNKKLGNKGTVDIDLEFGSKKYGHHETSLVTSSGYSGK